MPRRTILTARQRDALYGLPSDEPTFLQHYVLSDDDRGVPPLKWSAWKVEMNRLDLTPFLVRSSCDLPGIVELASELGRRQAAEG